MAERWSATVEDSSSIDAVSWHVEQKLCQPCSSKDTKTAADVFCTTCDEFQCKECSNVHKTHAFLRNHKLMKAKEVKSKPVSFDMKGLDQCEQHDEILKFFCEDENQLCCSTCAIVNHRKCQSVAEIQKIAGTSELRSQQLKARLHEVRKKTEVIGKFTESSKEQLDQDLKGIPLTIRQMRDDVNKLFEDLERSVTKDTESYKTEVLEKLEKRQSESKKHLTDATKYLETINCVHQNGTPSQQFIVEQRLNKNVIELYSRIKEECQNLETVTVSFEFDDILKLPPLPISDYVPGQLTTKYSLPLGVKPIIPMLNATKIASIDLKQTGDNVKEPLYSGLDFLPDGRLLAVDNRNKKCLIYNEKLEKVGSYQLSYIPQGVVAVSEEEVAITSAAKYKIDFLHVSKSNEITLARTRKVKSNYESVSLNDDGNFVAGTVDDTMPVRTVSLFGEEENIGINFPYKKYTIDSSACTYIRNSDKVALSDRCENTVYIYDTDTNTRVVVKDDQIKEPSGLAVGPSDSILVCCNEANTIIQISLKGRILSLHTLDMNFPYRVCFSQHKSVLAVTNNSDGNVQLQMFKITH